MSEFNNFGKKVGIPDAGEKTNNDPCYLMSSNDVLKLIKSNYANGTLVSQGTESCSLCHARSGKEIITPNNLIDGIIKNAIDYYGWSDVRLMGKQLLFIK